MFCWRLDDSVPFSCFPIACFPAYNAINTTPRYLHGDMANFALPPWESDTKEHRRQVDSAWCLLGSAGHLLTNQEMEGMLR